MSVRTRCLFVVDEVVRRSNVNEEIRLNALASDKDNTPEEQRFSKYTPSGSLKFTVNNPNVVGKINPGEMYYIDLIPLDPENN